MSAAATARQGTAVIERPQRGDRPRLFDDGVTLEDRILGAWEDLVVEGRAACPVCGGSMVADSGCRDCGSELA
jgi:hypothetical protein